MRVAPAVGPLAIKIIRMIGDTRHLAASPLSTLSAVPEGHRISAGGELSAQFNFAACARDVIAQLVVRSMRIGASQPSGSDDHVPEEHSKKTNPNNPKDKAPRVATEGLVGGRSAGRDRSCETTRSPASEPTSPDIDKDFLNPSASCRCAQMPEGAFDPPLDVRPLLPAVPCDID
jgi:hypothetical protein